MRTFDGLVKCVYGSWLVIQSFKVYVWKVALVCWMREVQFGCAWVCLVLADGVDFPQSVPAVNVFQSWKLSPDRLPLSRYNLSFPVRNHKKYSSSTCQRRTYHFSYFNMPYSFSLDANSETVLHKCHSLSSPLQSWCTAPYHYWSVFLYSCSKSACYLDLR